MATVDPVWDERWTDLDNVLTATANRYGSATTARLPTLFSLIKCLQAFGESQFHFFSQGLNAAAPYELEGCRPEYAFSVILDQIAIDLNCIQLAIAQRLFAEGNTTLRTTLEKADRFAWRCLPYTEQGSDRTDTTVVTYFQKFPSIRVVPYAPVALIGIPFSCTSVDRDYLAIPHEVGHYIYWHRRSLRKNITVDSNVNHWLEEIFADVYGCLVAGPVIAADFQDLQLRFSDDDFLADDGEHPIPAIRPLIYHRILQLLQERQADLVNPYPLSEADLSLLSKRWNRKLSERNIATDPGVNFTVKKTDAVPPTAPLSFPDVDKVIKAILEVLFEKSKTVAGKTVPILPQKWLNNTPLQDQDPDQYAFDLFAQFSTDLAGLNSQLPRELVLGDAPVAQSSAIEPIVIPTSDLSTGAASGFAPLWTKWVKSEQLLGDPEQLPRKIDHGQIESESSPQVQGWEPVLSSGGWATKGPHGRK